MEAPDAEPPYAEAQRRVQRWLGRCLLTLQQYEKLLKAVLHDMQVEAWHAGNDDAGRAQFEQRRAFDQDALRTMTLGTLVKHFTGQFNALPGEQAELPDDGPMHMRFRWSFERQPAEYDRLVAGLRELVDLRNLLVHHFIYQFDLQTVAGCEAAQQALEGHYSRVLAHWEELRGIARHLADAADHMVRWMQSPEFLATLSTGKLPLANAPIVQALCDTLASLAPSGHLVSLREVEAKMRAQHPDHTPEHYGRSSWRQLIHDTGMFELRRAAAGSKSADRQLRLRTPLALPPPQSAPISARPAPAAPPAPRTPPPPHG